MNSVYEKNSLSLFDTVAMGTGVMIGAGILALTGQIAGLIAVSASCERRRRLRPLLTLCVGSMMDPRF